MIQKNILNVSRAAVALWGVAISGVSLAASFNVPTSQYPHIYEALEAAASGDEIRVANDYEEIQGFYELTGKNVTIRSYSPDFSTPAPGASWKTLAQADIETAMIKVTDGVLTVEGFGLLRGVDCNVFMMGSNSGLMLNDSVVSGTTRADTAGIKAAVGAVNVNVQCNNVVFQENGRCIWFRPESGGAGNTTAVTLNNCQIINNISYTIAYDPNRQGNHTLTMTDCYMNTVRNRGMRVFGWRGSQTGVQTNFTVNIDRCEFVCLPAEGSLLGGRYPIAIDGYDTANSTAASSFVTNIRNCLFDLRNGDNDLETVAVNTQDQHATRKAEINMEHCTVVFGGTNQCGVRLRENLSVMNVRNCIFDGGTEGNTALRALQGTINSYNSLLNAPTIGTLAVSSENILSQEAGFEDRANGDLHLASDSVCLNAGLDLGILVDLEGATRPQGSAPDLGCYEREVAAAVSDWNLY